MKSLACLDPFKLTRQIAECRLGSSEKNVPSLADLCAKKVAQIDCDNIFEYIKIITAHPPKPAFQVSSLADLCAAKLPNIDLKDMPKNIRKAAEDIIQAAADVRKFLNIFAEVLQKPNPTQVDYNSALYRAVSVGHVNSILIALEQGAEVIMQTYLETLH